MPTFKVSGFHTETRLLQTDNLYPARTVMPHGVGWPEVGGYSPALGPLLPPERRALHLSIRGP